MTLYKDVVKLESDVVKLLNDEIDTSIIAKYLSYVIVGDINSEHNKDFEMSLGLKCSFTKNHGLVDLLLKMTSEYEHSHISVPEIEQLITPIPNFNLTFKNQCKLHPTVDFLHSILSPFHSKKSNVILDLYIDDTFIFNPKVYKILKIIPYVNEWCGFVYDTKGLFDNDDFIASLKYCKGLFVFSDILKNKIIRVLFEKKIDVKVFRFYYPVLEPKVKFEKKGIVNNVIFGSTSSTIEKSDVFSFYSAQFKLTTKRWFKKTTKQLNKYTIAPELDELPEDKILYKISASLGNRNWNNNLIVYLLQTIGSVRILNKDTDIDEILSNNIVFCNIIKGSVLVILNQCIVRSTPIIINKHPVVVELLGSDYPLYYTGNNEIILSETKIMKARKHLIKLNETKLRNKFQVNTFIATLNKVIEQF